MVIIRATPLPLGVKNYGMALVDSVKLKRRGDVRQAKLYYLRELTGRAARISEKLDKKAGEQA